MAERGTKLQKQAIEFEKNGVFMYLEAAGETNNPLARRLFYSLAIEEIEHITWIEDRLSENALPEKGDILEEKIKHLFQSLKEIQIKEESDNVESLEKAMQMERKGRDLYKSLRDQAVSEGEREFFRRLVAEEERHLTSLENVYSYLTESEDWFHNTEANTWNWMNL